MPRPKIKEEQPEISFKEMGTKLGQMWKELSDEEKAPWQEKADEDKVRYKKEMESYVAPERESDDDEPIKKKVKPPGINIATSLCRHCNILSATFELQHPRGNVTL